MLIIIGLMFLGIVVGLASRKHRLQGMSKLTTFFIWVLLFLLGIEVGSNESLIRSLPTLGLEAVFLALCCTVGSTIGAWLLWRVTGRRHRQKGESES